jgi:hypothetical protein
MFPLEMAFPPERRFPPIDHSGKTLSAGNRVEFQGMYGILLKLVCFMNKAVDFKSE